MTHHLNRRTLLSVTAATALTAGMAGRTFAQTAAATPALPAAPTPAQWATAPDLYNICMSPDGLNFAFIHEEGGEKYMKVFSAADNKSQTFDLGKAEISELLFADSDHIVVKSQGFDKGGADKRTHDIGTIYNIRSKSTHVLFADMNDFGGELSTGIGTAIVGGKQCITVGSFKVTNEDFQYLYLFDLDGHPTLLDQGPTQTETWLMAGDGSPVARSAYYEKTREWQLEYRQNGAWKTIYSAKFDFDRPSVRGLAADGKSIMIAKLDADGETRYYPISSEGVFGAALPFTIDQATLLFDPITKYMNGHSLIGDWPTHVYDDPVMADINQKAQNAVQDYRMRIVGRGNDPHRVIVYSEGADDSGTYYYIDFLSGKTASIGESYPTISPAWLSSKKPISYKAADGLEIDAYLSLPVNKPAANLPLVVMPHNGPEGRDDISLDTDVEMFTALGYAVLQPNYRGSSGRDGAFRRAAYGEYGRKMVTDLSDGVAFLVSQGTVDAKRVAIMGYGFGGSMVLNSVTSQSGIYACAIAIEGIADIDAMLNGAHGATAGQTTYGYRYYLRYLGDMSKIDDILPVKHADKMNVPLFMINSDAVSSGLLSQSKSMVAALKAAGKDVTYDEHGWFLSEADRIWLAGAVTAFVQQHMPAV